jgi:hypothetical protein
MPEEAKPAPEADIVDLLRGIDDGALYAQITDDITSIVATLRKRAAEGNPKVKARLTIALGFVFDGKVVQIVPEVTTKLPRPRHGQGVYWATRDNKLSPQNPQQLELGVARDVSTSTPPRHLHKA